MDVFAATEGRASFEEGGRATPNNLLEENIQPTETDNKFQKAIAAWKGKLTGSYQESLWRLIKNL